MLRKRKFKERTSPVKDFLRKIKRPLCGAVMALCLLLLLGCTGTAELGGNITTYCVQGASLLLTAIIAGVVGGVFG